MPSASRVQPELSLPNTQFTFERLMLRPSVDTLPHHGAVLLSLLASLRDAVRPRAVLQAEVLALRHQLLVLQRSRRPRIRLGDVERV